MEYIESILLQSPLILLRLRKRIIMVFIVIIRKGRESPRGWQRRKERSRVSPCRKQKLTLLTSPSRSPPPHQHCYATSRRSTLGTTFVIPSPSIHTIHSIPHLLFPVRLGQLPAHLQRLSHTTNLSDPARLPFRGTSARSSIVRPLAGRRGSVRILGVALHIQALHWTGPGDDSGCKK